MCCCFSYRNPCGNSCCRCPYRSLPYRFSTPSPQPVVTAPSVASFVQIAQTQIAAGSPLSLAADFNSDPDNYDLNLGSVILKRGYYIVSFNANVSAPGEQVSLALTLNNVVVPKTQTISYSDATGGANLSSSFILYVPTNDSSIGLINTGADAAQYSNVNLVLRKINVQ